MLGTEYKDENTMTQPTASIGDNKTPEIHHRLSLPSIFRHLISAHGDFMVTPIKLVDR